MKTLTAAGTGSLPAILSRSNEGASSNSGSLVIASLPSETFNSSRLWPQSARSLAAFARPHDFAQAFVKSHLI